MIYRYNYQTGMNGQHTKRYKKKTFQIIYLKDKKGNLTGKTRVIKHRLYYG